MTMAVEVGIFRDASIAVGAIWGVLLPVLFLLGGLQNMRYALIVILFPISFLIVLYFLTRFLSWGFESTITSSGGLVLCLFAALPGGERDLGERLSLLFVGVALVLVGWWMSDHGG